MFTNKKSTKTATLFLILMSFAAGFIFLPPLVSKLDDSTQQELIQGVQYENTFQNEQKTQQPTGIIRDNSAVAEEENDLYNFFTSTNGNVDIGVIFLSPLLGEKEDLVFKVMLDTHFVDLSPYKNLVDFIELRTDRGMIITENFEWTAEAEATHHVSGELRIRNLYKDKPILDSDTSYLELVFRSIENEDERIHAYQGEDLIMNW